MEAPMEKLATAVTKWAGKPIAFVAALALVVVWGLTGPVFGYSDTWQLYANTGTTLVTFLMVFLLQASQNREGSAIQVKLDELIRALDKARNDLIGLERRSEAEIEEKREEIKPPAKLVERKPLPRSPWDWWGL